MERKTIGAFIAALRKNSGMTQKDLAERLHVSDKAVSRWERDDSSPDLSLIPEIADIFGITCDEVLRGERKKAAEREEYTEAASAQGEKERQHLLKTTLSCHQVRSYIAMGIALMGFIAAMVCNFAFFRGLLGFFLGALFFMAAGVCQKVFTIYTRSALENSELTTEEGDRACRCIDTASRRVYFLLSGLVGFTAPLLFLARSHDALSIVTLCKVGLPGALFVVTAYILSAETLGAEKSQLP